MQQVIVLVGIPASGKSTWAKDKVKEDQSYVRINRDELRIMMNNYVFSSDNEKLVVSTRDHILRAALRMNRNIIIDDCNINRRNFSDIVSVVKSLNINCTIMEKSFYIDLNGALERNNTRDGVAKVPDIVIKKMWNQSGKEQHKFYKPRIEIIKGNNFTNCLERTENQMIANQDETKPVAIICDIDGTFAIVGKRSPYNAANCDEIDFPNMSVINLIKLLQDNNHQIIFCSGRSRKDELPTRRFIDRYLGNQNYLLFMRDDDDKRKDAIFKEEIYRNNIENKFYIKAVFDDRLSVCQLWYKLGLPLFRVGSPDSTF